MIRRVRHKLRMIRYHSATRHVTIWSQALDVACLASVALAVPAAWICNAVVQDQAFIASTAGHIHLLDDNSVVAVIADDASRTNNYGKPEGNYKIEVIDHRRGWPFPTSITRRPAKVDLDILNEIRPRGLMSFDPTDPAHQAIDAELGREGFAAIRDALHLQANQSRHNWKGWFASSAVWLIMLVGASAIMIGLTRYSAQIIGGKRSMRHRQLRAQGKCVGCGYDMTGLEFNERCPECGSLVY